MSAAQDGLSAAEWEAQIKGFKSVQVTVLAARDLGDKSKPPQAFTVVSVDSKSYKGQLAVASDAPTWFNSHFEFPLLPTSQYVTIQVYAYQKLATDKYLGRVVIPMREIQLGTSRSAIPIDEQKEKPAATDEKGTPVLTAWFNIDSNTSFATPPTSPRGSSSVSGRPLLQVKAWLSREEPKESGKPLVEKATTKIGDGVRHLVSKKKRRWQEDGFDLDLTYITDHVIAMGFPSQSVEGVYRNHLSTIKAFFNKRHPNAYKVYNLCSERDYPPSTFPGPVVRFPFADHNAYPFSLIPRFCNDAHQWLSEHPQRVAAIHCKAGKGRTGLLIACYMVFTAQFPTALASLLYYGDKRTRNQRGVTIPSQIRYVHYFDRYLATMRGHLKLPEPEARPEEQKVVVLEHVGPSNGSDQKDRTPSKSDPSSTVSSPSSSNGSEPSSPTKDKKEKKPKKVKKPKHNGEELKPQEHLMRAVPLPETSEWVRLRSIRLEPLPFFLKAPNAEPTFTIMNHRPDESAVYFSSKKTVTGRREKDGNGYMEFNLFDEQENKESILPLLCGDLHIVFKYPGTFGLKKMFQGWFNTQFLPRTPAPQGFRGCFGNSAPYPDFYAVTNSSFTPSNVPATSSSTRFFEAGKEVKDESGERKSTSGSPSPRGSSVGGSPSPEPKSPGKEKKKEKKLKANDIASWPPAPSLSECVKTGESIVVLTHKDLDSAVKDKKHKKYPAEFKMTLRFDCYALKTNIAAMEAEVKLRGLDKLPVQSVSKPSSSSSDPQVNSSSNVKQDSEPSAKPLGVVKWHSEDGDA